LLADDIILIVENLEDVYNTLDEGRLALTGKESRISRNKPGYKEYTF